LYWYGADNVGSKTLYSYIQTAIEACGTNSYCSRIEFFTACNGTVARSFLVNGVGVGCFASTVCTPSLIACTTSAAAITIDGYSKLSFKDRGTEYGTINASRYNFGGESTMMSFQSGNCFLFLNGTNCLMFIGSNGDVGIGTTSTSTEANLFLGAKGAQEGGQMVLQKGTSCTCATHLDNYQNSFRIMSGTNTGSTTVNMSIDHTNGAATFVSSVIASQFLTVSGTVSNPFNVWTTIFTVPTGTVARYELIAVSQGNSGTYTSQATIVANNDYVAVRNYTDGGALAIQASGYDVQVKNGSGSTLSISYKYIRIQ
jgi:hypothetical protein